MSEFNEKVHHALSVLPQAKTYSQSRSYKYLQKQIVVDYEHDLFLDIFIVVGAAVSVGLVSALFYSIVLGGILNLSVIGMLTLGTAAVFSIPLLCVSSWRKTASKACLSWAFRTQTPAILRKDTLMLCEQANCSLIHLNTLQELATDPTIPQGWWAYVNKLAQQECRDKANAVQSQQVLQQEQEAQHWIETQSGATQTQSITQCSPSLIQSNLKI